MDAALSSADEDTIFDLMDSAAVELEDTPARWIPCSERLPEICESTSYLAYIPSFCAVDIVNYSPDVEEWAFMGMPITVTHWMPLPEPPEGKDDECKN